MKEFNENIIPILAVMWTFFTFWLYGMYVTGNLTTDTQISILVINSVTNIIMLIIGFYFGSSKGSKDKDKPK